MTAHYPDAEAARRTVLVAVINNALDLRRAAEEGWYRIPQRHAPRRIGLRGRVLRHGAASLTNRPGGV